MLTLSQLKQYLRQKQQTTLPEMSVALKEERDVVEMMLQYFVAKGQVRVCAKTPLCGTKCNDCGFARTMLYEWV